MLEFLIGLFVGVAICANIVIAQGGGKMKLGHRYNCAEVLKNK